MKNLYLIIDFDSTFIKVEALEELAKIALCGNPQKETIIEKIRNITNAGMEGRIPFKESLASRIKFLKINRHHIVKWQKKIAASVSESISRNREFLQKNKENIYILSGAFMDCIMPLIEEYELDRRHVFANTFVFDKNGEVTGVELNNPLSGNDGKVEIVRSLRLKGKVYVIGDGISDYKIKQFGLAHCFFAYCENVWRENVVVKADHVVYGFDEVLKICGDLFS